MLSVHCSHCGAPTPIALSSDSYQCVRCGAIGTHTPQAMQQLVAARQLLFGLDARSRQLGRMRSAALRWSSVMIGLYLVLMTLFLALFAGCAAWVGDQLAGETIEVIGWLGALAALPVVVFFAGGLFGLPAQLIARKKLERSCAASPPARPGEPARCHVCGGPVSAQGAKAVARCSYCHADNILTARAVALAADRAVLDIGDFQRDVQRSSLGATFASLISLLILPVTAIASPIISVVVWGVAVFAATSLEMPVDRKVQLVEVDVKQGRCLAQYFPEKPAGQRIYLGGYFDQSEARSLDRPGLKVFDGRALVGRQVRLMYPPEFSEAVIVRTWSSPMFPGTVYARVKNKTGEETTLEVLAGICFR